jgi:hypothetical protein
MSNALLPLPPDEVGVGARWEDRRQVAMNGLVVTQVGTFELGSLRGDLVTIELTVKQSAKPGVVADPRLPPGTTTEILAMEGSGAGKVSVHLTKLDVSSTVKMTNQVETKVSGLPADALAGAPPGVANPATPTSMRTLMSTTMDLTMQLTD